MVLAGMADSYLPWAVRMRFADLMKSLWIDRPPFHPLILPRRVRVAVDDFRANSRSSEEKAEFADFGITDPRKTTDNFVVLQVKQIVLGFSVVADCFSSQNTRAITKAYIIFKYLSSLHLPHSIICCSFFSF